MKKNFLRIMATASIVVALLFVIVLLIAVFGGITEEEFNNGLVQGLFVALGVVFVLLAAGTLTLLFLNEDAAKEIVLRADKDGATRTTVGVVKKITKETVALIDGVKCSKSAIVSNDYGVRLKITVKVQDVDVNEAEKYVRACLEDAFLGKLNFKFYSIEIKVVKLKSKYAVDVDAVKKTVDEQIALENEDNAPAQTEDAPIDEDKPVDEIAATVDEEPEEEPAADEEPEEIEPAHLTIDPTTLDSPVE